MSFRINSNFAPLALDVVFARECKSTMSAECSFRGIPSSLNRHVMRHARFDVAILPAVLECDGKRHQQSGAWFSMYVCANGN